MKSLLKYLLLLLFPQFGFSAVGPTVEVFGKIIRYDRKKVTISQEDQRGKSKITVPKESIPKHFKIQTGQCVYAVLDYKRFMNNIKTLQEKAKVKPSKMKNLQKNMDN